MKRLLIIIYIITVALPTFAQERRPQNKPYIDLRPMHFGISVGFHIQDIEFQNVGPQVVTLDDGTTTTETVVCDQDNWNPGFSVGGCRSTSLCACSPPCTSVPSTWCSAI